MKKYQSLLIFFLILVIAVTAVYWWNQNSGAVSADQSTTDFLIVRGRSASQIGESLYEQGLIKNPLAFKIYVQVTGQADQIQAGEFRLSPSYNLSEIVNALTRGPVELWVTVPEGLRREQVVERFVESLEMGTADAMIFRQEFLARTEGLEGFLFPDTYLFPRDVGAQTVVSAMRNTFDRRISDLQNDIERSDLTLSEIIILASIIERETKTNEERPFVAGILLKRVEANVAMQADATVQYVVGSARCEEGSARCDWWPEITRADLVEIDSPYNTYAYRGFPPAPIANPGLSSIKASVNPIDSPYWYYIHDPNGQIHYAETLEQHNENVRRYLTP